jgi:hypothetical protein
MRRAAGRPFLVVLASLSVAFALFAAAPPPPPDPADDEGDDGADLVGPPPGWPDAIELPRLPDRTAPPRRPLPEATLVEPFEIGEALYDPGRAEEAALSLLDLLGVAIGEGEGKWLRPGRAKGGAPFHFSEAEARGFAARAVAAAELAEESGESALRFADLHAAVAPELPGWSAERLAAAYQQAYERAPDDVAPRVMLGQPITPETPLLYPQLWLLLVDGFAPPAGTPRPGRATPAQAPPTGGGSWGTAAQLIPPIHASNSIYLLPHIGHWVFGLNPDIVPTAPGIHEGHGGPGAPVTLVASFPTPQPIRDPNGTVLVDVRRPPALAGLTMTWSSQEEGKFRDHGAMSEAFSLPLPVDSSGSVRNTYTPKTEAADGQGDLVRDSAKLTVGSPAGDVADAFLHMTPRLGQWLFTDGGRVARTTNFRFEWHELGTIDVYIQNEFDVRLPLPDGLTARRRGRDTVFGTLSLQPDGTWYGLLTGQVIGLLTDVKGLDKRCPRGRIVAHQDLHVTGTVIPGFGPTHPDSAYDFPPAWPGAPARTPDDFPEKLSLELVPASEPFYLLGPNRCWPDLPSPYSTDKFLPFNDAQWTLDHAGYGIAVPPEGEKVAYTEKGGAAAGGSGPQGPGNPAGPALRQLLRKFGTSTWYVKVDHKKRQP